MPSCKSWHLGYRRQSRQAMSWAIVRPAAVKTYRTDVVDRHFEICLDSKMMLRLIFSNEYLYASRYLPSPHLIDHVRSKSTHVSILECDKSGVIPRLSNKHAHREGKSRKRITCDRGCGETQTTRLRYYWYWWVIGDLYARMTLMFQIVVCDRGDLITLDPEKWKPSICLPLVSMSEGNYSPYQRY